MYQLLLVEDEDIIRNGLLHIIEKLNLEALHISEARNGLEAIEIAKKTEPHIVITDIRMPFMDGLELIESLRNLLPNAEFIILSGYSEFEYARKAITLGVKEYLLKPINKEQLAALLHQTIDRLEEQEQEKQNLNETLSHFAMEISHLQKALLWKILNGKYDSEKILLEITDSRIHFPEKYSILLSFRGTRLAEASHLEENFSYVEDRLKKNCPPLFRFVSEYGYVFYLLNLPSYPHRGLDEFLSYYKNLPSPFPMGVSEVVHSPEFLPVLLKQSRSALDNRLFYFDTRCFFYYNFRHSNSDIVFSSQFGEKILLALNKGNGEARHLIKGFFLKLLETREVTAEWIGQNIKALGYYLFSHTMLKKENQKSRLELEESIDFFLSTADTYADFSNTIIEQMLLLEKNNSSKNTQSAAINQCINYVQKYYAKDITLVYMANFVSMNDTYFSTLFKKTTGTGFIKFLQDVRIQNAKRLLKDPSVKIYEAAEMVGFQDDKYFCKIFKKITGVTPSDYKNSLPVDLEFTQHGTNRR